MFISFHKCLFNENIYIFTLTISLDLSQDFAMKYWRDQGVPVEKLRMGFATYGRTFNLASTENGVGVPTSGPAAAGMFTREAGFWSYYEVHINTMS